MRHRISVNTRMHFPPLNALHENAGMYKREKAADTPIANVLATLMASKQIPSANALARETKLPQPTISRILNGSTKDPESATVRILADFFGVSEAQMRGAAPITCTTAQNEARAIYNVEPGPDIRGKVPLISWVQAGHWTEVIDNFAPGDAEEWLPCPCSHSDQAFALRVRGESMYNPHSRPSFADGDLIYVDPQRAAQHRSLVVVRLEDRREATFKQLIIEGDKSYLKALNPAWPEPMIEINGTATICGVVIFKGERL